jgi:hypothetical protein
MAATGWVRPKPKPVASAGYDAGLSDPTLPPVRRGSTPQLALLLGGTCGDADAPDGLLTRPHGVEQ